MRLLRKAHARKHFSEFLIVLSVVLAGSRKFHINIFRSRICFYVFL